MLFICFRINLLQFQNWLTTRSGGKKSIKEAKKNSANCSAIFLAVKLDDIGDLWKKQTLNSIEHDFITPKIKTAQASTVKNHLLSLKKLTEYMRIEDNMYRSRDDFERVQEQIKLWNVSLGKDIRIRAVEKGAIDQCKYGMLV